MSIRNVQEMLRDAGFSPGAVDGLWGRQTRDALALALSRTQPPAQAVAMPSSLAWGARVDHSFRVRAVQSAARIETPADDLMSCIAFETGRTFSPKVRNPASSATGLIQFMRATAISLGTTVEQLAAMTAVEQFDYVDAYFKPYRGRLKNLGDLYMAILWPRGIGQSDSYVLWRAGTEAYRVNAGLDRTKKGYITRGNALETIQGFLAEGRRPENIWVNK